MRQPLVVLAFRRYNDIDLCVCMPICMYACVTLTTALHVCVDVFMFMHNTRGTSTSACSEKHTRGTDWISIWQHQCTSWNESMIHERDISKKKNSWVCWFTHFGHCMVQDLAERPRQLAMHYAHSSCFVLQNDSLLTQSSQCDSSDLDNTSMWALPQ